jgi:methyl-accepting chemotaxis protein WspA
MKKLSVRNRILASLGMILAIMLLIGGFVYSGLSTIERHAWDVKTDMVPGLYRSSLIRDALAADYQLVLSTSTEPNPAAKRQLEQKLDQGRAKLDALIADYRQTVLVEADRQAFARFEAAYARHRDGTAAMLSRPLDLSNFQSVRDQFAREHQPRFDAATKAITDVAALNQQRATEMLELVDRESRALLVGIALSFTLAVGLALVVGLGLFRSITTPLARLGGLMDAVRQGDFTQRMEVDRTDEFGDLARGFNRMTDEVMELVGQVQRSGIRVSTSMTEIAATSKQQQATATEVAATTTQIGATSREIAATSRELVRTMTDVASVADNAASLASSGQSGLAHMEETMGHVMEAASSINAKLAVLNEKAGDINQVVTTITKVADQTNLLSLNAAIEAEKAGEYGRGFAVVSSEIRRLADQTAVATYDIEQMVKEIQSAVSAGVMGMDKFSEEVRRGLHDVHEIGGKLSEIIAQVQALAPRFENVSEGMQAQATGAEQISEALVQLTEATQQTVESLRQSSSAIDELNQVSGNLHGSIARFKLAAA